MDLKEPITLTSEEGHISLPLENLLRITMVYLTKLLPEYYSETKSDNIKDFWKWTEQKLGMGKGKQVLI